MTDIASAAAMFLLSFVIALVMVVGYVAVLDFWDRRR